MKHFLLILALLIIPFTLFASGDDLSKSKGTTQNVIVQLTPSPAQSDVSRNMKIEVAFSVPLDASAIKEHDVKLTYLSSKTNEHMAGTISCSQTEKKLTFTPKASLEPGLYEVEIKSLKVDKAYKATKINEIKYRFVVINEVLQSITIRPERTEIKEGESLQLEVMGYYDTGVEKDITIQVQWSIADSQIVTVDANATLKALKEGTTTVTAKMESIEVSAEITVYKEINGHRLPPEPDPTINNATLLGIDVNGNGVRDDVERWIMQKYATADYPKTKTAIAMQWGKTVQQIIQNPENAYEDKKYLLINRVGDCQMYAFSRKLKKSGNYWIDNAIFNDDFVKKVFNTKERIKAYYLFNTNLAGHVYGGTRVHKSKCDFDIDAIQE